MYANASPAVSRRGLALVVALHAIVFWGLLQVKLIALPVPLAVRSVSLLAPPVFGGRGRDDGYPPPPAQIRTCRIAAYGSCIRW